MKPFISSSIESQEMKVKANANSHGTQSLENINNGENSRSKELYLNSSYKKCPISQSVNLSDLRVVKQSRGSVEGLGRTLLATLIMLICWHESAGRKVASILQVADSNNVTYAPFVDDGDGWAGSTITLDGGLNYLTYYFTGTSGGTTTDKIIICFLIQKLNKKLLDFERPQQELDGVIPIFLQKTIML